MEVLPQNTEIGKRPYDDFRMEYKFYVSYWPWFVLSFLTAIALGSVYIKSTDSQYLTYSTIKIVDHQQTSASPNIIISGIGVENNQGDMENEIFSMRSDKILFSLVEELNLNHKIEQKGFLKNNLLWIDEVPFSIIWDQNFDKKRILQISLDEEFNSIVKYEDKQIVVKKYDTLKVDSFEYFLNKETIESNLNFNKSENYVVSNMSRETVVENLKKRIVIENKPKGSNFLELSITGAVPEKNNDILSTLIEIYNREKIYEKQKYYYSTISFINNRIDSLGLSLNQIEKEKVDFLGSNQIIDLNTQSGMAISNNSRSDEELSKNQIQIEITNSLKGLIQNSPNYSLIPENIGIQNINTNSLIANYNNLILERNSLLLVSKEANPSVNILNNKIKTLKENLINVLDNSIRNISLYNSQFDSIQKSANVQILKIPRLQSDFRDIERKLEIIEKIYVYLLEKREEISISASGGFSPIKIIFKPKSSIYPIKPNKKLIYIGFILLSLLLPIFLIFISKRFNYKLNNERDIKEYIPNAVILAKIPLLIKKQNIIQNQKNEKLLRESFNLLRTNLSYLNSTKKISNEGEVILVTSLIKGEGKTFISSHISKSLASLEHKTVIIGTDMRNPRLHKEFDIDKNKIKYGLSQLLASNEIKDIDKYLYKDISNIKNLDLIPSGGTPPNPSELLNRSNFKELILELKKIYDFIIFDSPPILLVSDTLIFSNLADKTIMCLRSDYTKKEILNHINEISEQQKLVNVAFVLNGIKISKWHNRYEYNYGYEYVY